MEPAGFVTDILIPALSQGLVITLQLIALSAPFGFLLGIGVSLGRQYGGKTLSNFCKLYVIFVKGCPLLLLLFILYFGLPSIGITLTAFAASVTGFILCNAAYNSEYIRGAILSIKDGQTIAAQALYCSVVAMVMRPAIERVKLEADTQLFPNVRDKYQRLLLQIQYPLIV